MANILNIGSGNGLLSDGTKLLHEPKLIHHQSIPVKLPWIFPGATKKIYGAPRNIQGNLTTLSKVFCDIITGVISQEVLMYLIHNMCLMITLSNLQQHLPGANELANLCTRKCPPIPITTTQGYVQGEVQLGWLHHRWVQHRKVWKTHSAHSCRLWYYYFQN